MVLCVKMATINITKTQKLLREERKPMISYDNIAKVLYMRGLLRNITTMQIASNKNFVSIEFKTQQLLETFCIEGLLAKGLNIEFNPDKKKPPSEKHLLNISFLNIPPETPEHLLKEFLSIYADIEGTPLYVKKTRNRIEYTTGIGVYQVTRLYEHIPRPLKNMFGRTVCCIYDEQPEEKEKQAKRKREKFIKLQKKTKIITTPTSLTKPALTRMKKTTKDGKKLTAPPQQPTTTKKKTSDHKHPQNNNQKYRTTLEKQ